MTYRFGKRSLENMEGVLPQGVLLLKAALSSGIMDFGVYEGVRDIDTQELYYKTGRSKTMNSKHLIQPDGYGHAVDLYPYPINMNLVNKGSAKEIVRFGVLNGIIQSLSPRFKLKVRWGGDWDGDGETLDHNFFDAMHFEFYKLGD